MAAEGIWDTASAMLRMDLGLYKPPEQVDAYLAYLISVSVEALGSKNITLAPASVMDQHLVSMYAAWLYRKRDGSGAMPEPLSYAIRNRQVSEVTAT